MEIVEFNNDPFLCFVIIQCLNFSKIPIHIDCRTIFFSLVLPRTCPIISCANTWCIMDFSSNEVISRLRFSLLAIVRGTSGRTWWQVGLALHLVMRTQCYYSNMLNGLEGQHLNCLCKARLTCSYHGLKTVCFYCVTSRFWFFKFCFIAVNKR